MKAEYNIRDIRGISALAKRFYDQRDISGISALSEGLEISAAKEWLNGNIQESIDLFRAAEFIGAKAEEAKQLIEEDSRLYDLTEIQKNAAYN